jgi:hypothetical protein
MEGKIYFDDIETLAVFLKEFTGSTATFEAWFDSYKGKWVLQFTGGC